MKREAPKKESEQLTLNSAHLHDAPLLIIAVFVLLIYFLKGFYISKEAAPLSNISSNGQTVFEVQDSNGDSKVYVYAKKEPGIQSQESEVKSGSNIVINKDGSAAVGFMSGEKHLIFSIPLDINKSAMQDFEALPGIGPKLAERIVETRERLGGFRTVEGLKKVRGMGGKKLDRIKNFIICKEMP